LLFIEFSPRKLQQQTHKQNQLLPRQPGNQKLFGDKLSQALTRVLEPVRNSLFGQKGKSVSQSEGQKDRRPDMMRSATKYSAKSTAATQNEVNHENCTGGSNFSF